MRGTSIAAIEHSNGDQRVVFQEASGHLRQAIYSESHQFWDASPRGDFQLVEDARNLTPLSAINDPSNGERNGSSVSTDQDSIEKIHDHL